MSYKHYDKFLIFRIVEEVSSGKLNKEEARRKYGIKGKSRIIEWMRQHGHAPLKTKNRKLASYSTAYFMAKDKSTEKTLVDKIKRLEKALQEAELKAAAYEKMVELAEIEFKINIRKKLSTRKSLQ